MTVLINLIFVIKIIYINQEIVTRPFCVLTLFCCGGPARSPGGQAQISPFYHSVRAHLFGQENSLNCFGLGWALLGLTKKVTIKELAMG